MFTGLVEALGTVRRVVPEGPGVRLAIELPAEFLPGLTLGESIAINGCCLTVVAAAGGSAEFQAGPETLSKTNLGRLGTGDAVNLERSLQAGARLGGHFVQGHVDGVGRVAELATQAEWVDMTFTATADLLRLMVPKGSVAVDGVSLTVVHVGPASFSVSLIPHTLAVTTLGRRRVGDEVNLETDMLGKYVARLLEARGAT